jgi:hypothetical protein
MLTASEMHMAVTPTFKRANNADSRSHACSLLAQRLSGNAGPNVMSPDIMRGHRDEPLARELYSREYAPVKTAGFVTREITPGTVIGCSPDGLVGDDGIVEIKSRLGKYHVKTALDIAAGMGIPGQYRLQIQTALLVTDRKWCDFISYCGGLPMIVERVYVDQSIRDAIENASVAMENTILAMMSTYYACVSERGWHPTERRAETDGGYQWKTE